MRASLESAGGRGQGIKASRGSVVTRVVMRDFPKIRVLYFGVLLVRILLFRVLY